MNENALCVEMGIPLLAHPKHTYSKIGGLTDSDSEYPYDSEDELDSLIQYSKCKCIWPPKWILMIMTCRIKELMRLLNYEQDLKSLKLKRASIDA